MHPRLRSWNKVRIWTIWFPWQLQKDQASLRRKNAEAHNQDTNLKNEFIKHHYSHTWLRRTYKPYLETLLCVNFLFDLIRHDYPWKSPLKTEQTFHCDKNFPPCRRKLPTWRSRASLKLPTWLFRCQAVFCLQQLAFLKAKALFFEYCTQLV